MNALKGEQQVIEKKNDGDPVKTAVIAVGGNALITDPQKKSIHHQYEAARGTAAHIVALLLSGWRVVLTHGNGPQACRRDPYP